MKHITKSCPSTSGYFIVNNLFNELSSEALKLIARENLGISDQYSLYWGNIKGYIEDLIDFILKLKELIREYGGELNSELERIVADTNTRLDNLLGEVDSILNESINNFEIESDEKLNLIRTEFNASMEQWSTAVTNLIKQWEDLNLLKYPYTNPKDPTIQTVGDALTKLGLGVAKVLTLEELYSFPAEHGDLVYVLENDVTYKYSKDGWQAIELALVISDSAPINTNVIWYEKDSDYDLNREGNLNSVRSSIKTLELLMALVLNILNYGIIAGDSSVGARTKLYSSAAPINPNTGEAEEEFIEPEGLLYTVPNLSIKCDTLENFSKNKRNLIDGELIWIIDKNSLYIYYTNKFIPISNTSGGGNGEITPEDDMTQEDIEKLYFNYLGLVNKNQDQFRMEVNENGNIIVYNTQSHDGDIGAKGAYGSYISDYLRINSIFIGGENTNLDSFSACSHNFVELANASESDINLYGLHLLYRKPGTALWEDLPLKGMIKAGSTFLIRGARCSYKSNITLDIEDYDLLWFNSKNNLILFDKGGGTFYLVCTNLGKFNNGSDWVDLSSFGTVTPYNSAGSPEGYVDLVGIKGKTDFSVASEGKGPITIKATEDIKDCIFVRSFTLDPCSQALKAHNKKSSDALWTYVNMSTLNELAFPYYTEKQKHLYVPKSSRWGKNIYGTRSTFSENTPNMVNITFGIQATDNGYGATRCFNWVSVGYYDEYVEYKKNSETWEQAKTKKSINTDNYKTEYASDSNVGEFINIYKRIKWVTTNNTAVTTHKAIIRGLEKGNYNYRIRRTSDPNYMSEIFNFTVRLNSDVNNEGFDFVHTTDQQAFNFYEYQAWTKAARAIRLNHPNIQFTLNTGDCTQNGNRESEWLDYYAGREVLRDIEEMYVIGNNDLCGVIPYELGDGNASKYKINHKNIQYYYTFEIDSNNPPIFTYVDSNLDINKMGDVLDSNSTMFKYYMPSVYSFNYGNYHFIGLNSEFAENTYLVYYNDSTKGNAIKQHAYYNMYKWLKKDLETNEGKNFIAFMHELPFCIIKGDDTTGIAAPRTETNGSKLNHDFSLGVSKSATSDTAVYTGGCNFSELFLKNNVKLALGGHKHTYSLSYPTKEKIDDSGDTRSVDYANPDVDKEGNDGVVYSMCQATGYKLVSNKELPGTGINWLRKYFPMSGGKASNSQYYPMYSLISTAGKTLELKSFAIYNIFLETTAFNINNLYIEFLLKNSTIIDLDPNTEGVLESITINY